MRLPAGLKKASTGFSRYVLQTVLKKTFYRLFYMSLKLTLMRRFRGPKKDHHARLRIVHPPGGWRPSALRGSGTFWPMAPLHLWSMTQSLFACPEQQKLLHPGALRLLHMFQTLDSGQRHRGLAWSRRARAPATSSRESTHRRLVSIMYLRYKTDEPTLPREFVNTGSTGSTAC